MSDKLPRPVVRWAGGKTQLLPELLTHVKRAPDDWKHYAEPFLGGAALFFAMKREGLLNGKRVLLTDANHELINAYQHLADSPLDIIRCLHRSKGKHSKEYYDRIRARFPWTVNSKARAAQFFYLNKTCFNGLWRVNRHGAFNVSMDPSKKRSAISSPVTLLSASKALRSDSGVILKHTGFRSTFRKMHLKSKMLFYVDPPYVPVSGTSNFTLFTRDGFTLDDHKDLRWCLRLASNAGNYFIASNSDTEVVRELYADFNLHEVQARRAINCQGNKRGKVGELIITNF